MTTARCCYRPLGLFLLTPLLALACGDSPAADSNWPGQLIEEDIPSASNESLPLVATGNPGPETPVREPTPSPEPSRTAPDERAPQPQAASALLDPPAGTAELSRECIAPPGVSNAPQSVEQLLALINALPSPVTLACFVSSLQRPLEVFMTSSRFSAQPAGFNSPRSFLFFGPMVLSVVPGGESRNLLEFGERTDTGRSIKGEIVFPVARGVNGDTLFDQVALSNTGSVCGGCHQAETRLDDQAYDAAFESVVILPDLRYEVSPEQLAEEATLCDREYEAERCKLLGALFDHGPVVTTQQWR